ncbi:hypothetical protein LR48_Vigan10g216400 [Vigna angularis]|uniref:Homeobox domain-containing protein n=1 Tax=Phaseolus angularis TaxID=3914 RepID=A0A0L9VMZ5_PHAAN|nr:hypothetical protein LR48_Vigan10g216400 [Vigna angularis]
MDNEGKTIHKRWWSTPEQVSILLNIFNHGIINPSRDQIREITGRLKEYGDVGEYNVYCWFQNHGSRLKQRGWPKGVSSTSEASYSLLPSFMYEKEIPQPPPLTFRTTTPSTELSLRPPQPVQEFYFIN